MHRHVGVTGCENSLLTLVEPSGLVVWLGIVSASRSALDDMDGPVSPASPCSSPALPKLSCCVTSGRMLPGEAEGCGDAHRASSSDSAI